MSERVGKGVIVAVVFAAVVYTSIRAPVPDPLPGVALGWTALCTSSGPGRCRAPSGLSC
jgi:hypothetical protein